MKTRLFAPHDRFTVGFLGFSISLIALVILSFFATGCGVLYGYKPVVPVVQTNPVVSRVLDPVERVEWRTNVVTVTNVLPGERIVVTNVQSVAPVIVFTNEVRMVTNQVVVTNGYAVNPQFQEAVENGRRLNSALNPTPTAPLVDWGLSLLTVGAGAVAAWKSKSARKAEVVRDTLIKAVETAPPSVSAAMKRHVAGVADLRGVSGALDVAVQKVTAAMADGRMTAEEFVELANDPSVTEDMIPEAMRAAFRKFRG